MVHLLDNPVWHALTGLHAGVALGRGAGRHYPRDMAPFSALAEASPAAYADLAAGLPAGVEARLFRPAEEPAPPGWEVVSARPIRQMAANAGGLTSIHPAEARVVELGHADVPDMQMLAGTAKPGPFGRRTAELGRYAGIRDANGRLLAMGGERFRLSGHVELSAICVHPDARGRGLGAALILHLARAALLAAGGTSIFLSLLGCVLFGLGIGNLTSLPPLIVQTEFARADVGRVVALVTAVNQAVFAFAPVTLGALRDTFGWAGASLALVGLVQVTALVMVLAVNLKRHCSKHRPRCGTRRSREVRTGL